MIHGGFRGETIAIDGSQTSQFLSGLLMGIPLLNRNIELTVRNLKSIPYVKMTVATLKKFGVGIYFDQESVFKNEAGSTYQFTRYTVEGLRSVPLSLHEAGTMSGVSRLQRWTNIELPLAFPHIMLGINQTVIFALFMVILGALIGTVDLGQIIMGALSRKGGAGIGFTLGIFVSFMCLAVDNLIRTWAEERKKLLGIE